MHVRLATSRRLAALVLAVSAVAASPAAGAPPAARVSPATLAISYVVGEQSADGGFFGAGQGVGYSGGLADTTVALLADDGATRDAVAAAVARLAEHGPAAMTRAAYAGRAVMALVAAGADPRDTAGYDYVAKLDSFYSPAGHWESQMYANALAALGVLAAGDRLPDAALLWFRLNQCSDGGFGWFTVCASGSDVDTTALVVNVLRAAGVPTGDVTLARARAFLVAARNPDGGYGGKPGTFTNANSTGLVLSAIAALGEQPADAAWRGPNGADPLAAILRLQTPSGGFLWREGDPGGIDNYATVQAIPGVAGQAYPIEPVLPGCERERPGKGRGPHCDRGNGGRPDSRPGGR